MPIRFQGFSGMAPRIDRRFLKDNQAQEATNCRVTSGALDSLREPGIRHAPPLGTTSQIFSSIAGGSWGLLSTASPVGGVAGYIGSDGSRLVITTYNYPRRIFYSDDRGLTWTESSPIVSCTGRPFFGNGVWIIPGSNASNLALRSTNGGVTWAEHANGGGSLVEAGGAYGNGIYILAKDGSTTVGRSTDGFLTQSAGTITNRAGNITDTIWAGDRFVILRDTTFVDWSVDGLTWTGVATGATGAAKKAAYGNGVLVVCLCQSTATYLYSLDNGRTWSFGSLPSSQTWTSIAFGGDRFMMYSGGANPDTIAYSSFDGINWIATTTAGSPRDRSNVAYAFPFFVAINSNNYTNLQRYATHVPVTVADYVTAQSVFRMLDAGTGLERWLAWTTDVDVQRSPVNGDTLQRVYWTGDGEPRASTFSEVFAGSGPYPGGSGSLQYVLGAFAPVAAPTVGSTGGSASNITVSFVYTFVTARGEESQPSPAGTGTAPSDATSWNLSAMSAAPANVINVTAASWADGLLTLTCSTLYGIRAGEQVILAGFTPSLLNKKLQIAEIKSATQITLPVDNPGGISLSGATITRVGSHNYGTGAFKRIYATVTGSNGVAEFRLWADNVAIGAATYSAAYSATAIAAATLLPSTNWGMPPASMRGLYLMPNGIMCGFAGNEVCFSEPFLPHAWPVGYRQSVPHKIMAIGGFGTTLVIGTTGEPYTINGIEPQTMGGGANVIRQPWPCLSKRGMTSADWGVLYPTTIGLAMIGPGGVDIATQSLYTEEEWRDLNPASFVSATLGSLYAAAFTPAVGSRQIMLVNKAEFSDLLRANVSADELWTDSTDGLLYLTKDAVIYRWDAPGATKMLFDWKSKDVLLPSPINFAAAKIDAEFVTSPEEQAAAVAAAAATAAANQALINADLYEGAFGLLELGAIEIGGELMGNPVSTLYESLQFQLYVDNESVFTKNVGSGSAFKLPAGLKSDTVAIRVAGNVKVRGVVLGSSVTDLRGA